MLDSSSSRTIDLEYHVRDPHLSTDELDLLLEFEIFCLSNRYMDANIVKKMIKKMDKSENLLGS